MLAMLVCNGVVRTCSSYVLPSVSRFYKLDITKEL